MKKIIKLKESDLLRIIGNVISEQIKQGSSGDPYQYKKVGNDEKLMITANKLRTL